jgi:hypothetical protein
MVASALHPLDAFIRIHSEGVPPGKKVDQGWYLFAARTMLVFRARDLSEFPATSPTVADMPEYCLAVRRAGKTFFLASL